LAVNPTERSQSPADDLEPSAADTNIHVVVRCRGRSDREIKENSGVVISTEGTRGSTVDVSMGPNAVSNKTYHFDKVFSAAADQSTIYEEVMVPILNEVSQA
jgi:kinesin family member 11